MQEMGRGFDMTYYPDESKSKIYEQRYQQYTALGGFAEQLTVTNKKSQTTKS